MSRLLYIFDDDSKDYTYDIVEDCIIHHFSLNNSSNVTVNLNNEGVSLYYYYHNINYDDNSFNININHNKNNTHSEVYNHGVNVNNKKLTYYVNGVVLKDSSKCICNQDNQIINLQDGKSTICPNLLIDNYDVDSNHSAYIGRVNDEELFYLMSRGITKISSIHLLLKSFLLTGVDIKKDDIKNFILEIDKINREE